LLDQTYPELNFEALNTPQEDWHALFNYMLKNGYQTLFDAGAGNALSAQVAQKHYPALKVYAYELLEQRLEGIDCPDQVVKVADLMQVPIPHCDITFLYLPTGPLLEKILLQLPTDAVVAAVESHGDLFDRLDECCSFMSEIEITAKRHHSKMRFYRYQSQADDLRFKIRELSTHNSLTQIIVKDRDPLLGEYLWSADVQDCIVESSGIIETYWPKRRFELSMVDSIQEAKWPQLVKERRQGLWRKLIVSPVTLKETPEGKRMSIHED
tara:strand:- start:11183 stop:11986 length:804 start_codon:yes stop_codon:yes gene_type:complete